MNPIRITLFSLLIFCSSGEAEGPRFANVFGDGIVLQRGQLIHVWGFDASEDSVLLIQFGSQKVKTTIEKSGRWNAVFPAESASGTGRDLSIVNSGGEVLSVIKNVVIGDVWLAAGQSNMQFRVKGMVKGLPQTGRWVDQADRNLVRFRRVNDPVLKEPEDQAIDLKAAENWVKMTPETVGEFSAVAAVFAHEIYDKTKVPIGIIDVSWGGKPIEPFMPREAFTGDPLLEKILELGNSESLEELAKIQGGVIIRNPQGYPGAIFNSRIAPLIPLGLKGFLWYQAESNAGRGEDPREYRKKMAALAKGWRERWSDQESKMPFNFVQLPGYPPASGWVRVREEQRLALGVISNSGMTVTIDLPGDDIHPPEKLTVGKRLARLATEGESGPLFQKAETKGAEMVVYFTHADSGLMVGEKPILKQVVETPAALLKWFEVADGKGNWHPATARIEGDTVVVTAEAVAVPVAVRYACSTNPRGGNLYNRKGLPASPFCSDLKLLPWIDQPPGD